MYRKSRIALLKTSVILLISSTAMADSALRIYCDDADEGAKIYVNGNYKADCPTDLFIPAGYIKLRVVKEVGSEYEKIFEKSFNLADNSAKKIEVRLSNQQLTSKAIAARRHKVEKQEKEIADAALVKARAGDINAMRQVASLYRQGKGFSKNPKRAVFWKNKAVTTSEYNTAKETLERARLGKEVSPMVDMAEYYFEGKGVKKDVQKAKFWTKKANALRTQQNLKSASLRAERALESAKSGNVSSMEEIARYYAQGSGVQKDMKASEMWNEIANKIKTEEGVRYRQQWIDQRAQAKMNEIDFFLFTKGTWSMADDIGDTPDPAARSTSYTAMPTQTLFGIAMDMTLAPTRSTKTGMIRARMASRPATFDRPDSMIAKAYRNNLAVHE